MNTWNHKSPKNCSSSKVIVERHQLSIFHGLKEIICSYIYPFLANSCTDCSNFHLTFPTQREKDLRLPTKREKNRSVFGMSPEKNTVRVVLAKTVY